jgi:hypothetical protein
LQVELDDKSRVEAATRRRRLDGGHHRVNLTFDRRIAGGLGNRVTDNSACRADGEDDPDGPGRTGRASGLGIDLMPSDFGR